MKIRLTPAMVVAMIALLVALSGTAGAATVLITGAQIRNGSIGLADLSPSAKAALRGQRGATGPQGSAGPQGSTGPQGAQGLQGERGLQGIAGAKGETGAPGPASLEELNGKPCKFGVMSVNYTDELEAAYDQSVNPAVPLPGSGVRGLEILCLRADRWEDNDSRSAAADVSANWSGSGMTTAFVSTATLLPAGDDDWYKLPNTRLDFQWGSSDKIKVHSGAAPVLIDIYRDGDLVAADVKTYTMTPDDVATPHDWEIRVHGAVAVNYSVAVTS